MPRAQSADGVIHDFPDGTDPAVIDRVMKNYATGQQPPPQGGASRPDLAGKLQVLPQFGSLGSTRPFGPGEYVMNSDGGWSNEYSVTVEDPRQSGRFMVVPSLWLKDGKPTLLSEDQAAETAAKSGLNFPTFDNERSAEAFSSEREAKWQKVPVGRSDLQPPLWQQQPRQPSSPLASFLREALGALGEAPKEIAAGAKDIGQAFVPGMDPRPGMRRLGDIAQFMTGGLQSPLGVEARGVDAGARIAAGGEARNLARELKAPAKIEKLEQQAAKPSSAADPFNLANLGAISGVVEAAARGDLKWLTVSLGSKAAEYAIKWARNPNRRVEDLQRFLDARRQARVEDMQRFVDEHGGAGLDELKRMIEERRPN